ncbi:hypothetical protein SARC_12265 [Sphaeroforma arctica JP610]|uniref:Glycosyl-hydrolase 114-associated domain-containing protein n=1 Tax=Sphaeroforma arctica JP610 TaxID=667725 RepID=A0A0L0FEL4_9EUKA|nr:hypothetical protein SARC_12265 [Sphaeroforma arctica JP610]KNC75204.1 hypothetical protein SARC_12265 [Sphaeroforma arctica JP610]|eukprot:XP_014149106.1 hypothetical protein SARC_12265 [Sphaeroforma arctica JP610]
MSLCTFPGLVVLLAASASGLRAFSNAPNSVTSTLGVINPSMSGISYLSTADASITGKPWETTWATTDSYFFDAQTSAVKGFSGTFTFSVNGATPSTITSMAVDTQWMGSAGNWNIWQFALKNYRTGQHDLILTNAAAGDWAWTDLSGNLTFPEPTADYMNAANQVELRYFSDGPINTWDDSFMSYLSLRVHEDEPRGSNTPPPTSTASPSSPAIASASPINAAVTSVSPSYTAAINASPSSAAVNSTSPSAAAPSTSASPLANDVPMTHTIYPISLNHTVGQVVMPFLGIGTLQTAVGVLGQTQEANELFYDDAVFLSSTGTPLGFDGVFTFQDASINPDKVTSITARILWNGPDAWNVWECVLKKPSGTEVPLVNNLLAGDYLWSVLTGTVPVADSSFVSATGVLQVRCFTNGPEGRYDNAFIDKFELIIEEHASSSSASPSPSGAAVASSSPSTAVVVSATPSSAVISSASPSAGAVVSASPSSVAINSASPSAAAPSTSASPLANDVPITHTIYPISLNHTVGQVVMPFLGIGTLQTAVGVLGQTQEANELFYDDAVFLSSTGTPLGFDGVFTFHDTSINPDKVTSITAKILWNGPDAWNVWECVLKKPSGAEVPLVNNLLAGDYLWSELTGTVPVSDNSFVSTTGQVQIRCFTEGPAGTFDSAFIDKFELVVKEIKLAPSASPAPTPLPSLVPGVPGLFVATKAFPKSLTTTKGEVVVPVGGISTLQVADAVIGASQGTEQVYLFKSNGTVVKGYSGVYKFDFPEVRENVTSISLSTTFMGPEGGWNRWQFKMVNFAANREKTLATNIGTTDWKWSTLKGNISFTYPESGYINEMREMHVRYFTDGPVGTFDNSLLNSLELTVHENEPRAPRPSALPKPTLSAPALPARSALAWTVGARACGMSLNVTVDNAATLASKIGQHKTEGCSVIEFDSGLSIMHTDQMFADQVTFLAMASGMAKAEGLRSVLYIPSLEVNIPGGCIQATGAPTELSMTNDPQKSNWLQTNLAGIKNVFCGELEVWVAAGMESAWFDPNNEEFKAWFLNRIRTLALSTELDGYWADVPIYSDTVGSWFGAGPDSDRLFSMWSKVQGYNSGLGYSACPTVADSISRNLHFRAWLKWRHETLADWQENIRIAAEQARPTFEVIAEVYPMDYLDPLWTGLDTDRRSPNLLRVWEVDSVSNDQGMEYSTMEDFRVKIAMNKYARAADGDTPSWVFAYGNKDLDAGLVMGAAVASGCGVFECKTPSMVTSVGSEFRRRWLTWIESMDSMLFTEHRKADVGVLHSAATRNHYDYPNGGAYGMYLETTKSPAADASWWAVGGLQSSALKMKHIGAYKGMMGVLTQLQVPHKVVLDHTSGLQSMAGLKVIILPSVVAISDATAQNIKDFVAAGGAVLATGPMPGTVDADGSPRTQSILADMFGFAPNTVVRTTSLVNTYGQGVAVYRPEINARTLFSGEANAVPEGPASPAIRAKTVDAIKLFVRSHVPENVIVQRLMPDGKTEATTKVYLEVGEVSTDTTTQSLHLMNLDGLRVPVVASSMTVRVFYRAPAGTKLTGTVGVHSPDESQWVGGVVANRLNQPGTAAEERAEALLGLWYYFDMTVDQFSLLVMHLESYALPALPSPPTPLPTGPWRDAMTEGFTFIKDKMRNNAISAPFKYGVYTNYVDILPSQEDIVYANGHHTTGEHMGIFLRAAACLNDVVAHAEGTRYVREVMTSKLLGVINWAVDKDTRLSYIQDDFNGGFANANAPLDDLRAIRGLIEGAGSIATDAIDKITAAQTALAGLYWTSVSDVMAYDASDEEEDTRARVLPNYSGGVMGYSYDWSETELNPTGDGKLGVELIPIDYSYLKAMSLAARLNPRWLPTLEASTRMLLDSEIGNSGLFYNGLTTMGSFAYTGDFEYRNLTETNRGRHLKTIQTLWIALHLAEIGTAAGGGLSPDLATLAREAAIRSFNNYNSFYTANGKRIPEYMTMAGGDVLSSDPYPLQANENLVNGEARIYSQFANLAYILGDTVTANAVMTDKVVPDRVISPTSPVRGCIGSSASANDCEAFNTLEAVNRLCHIAQG